MAIPLSGALPPDREIREIFKGLKPRTLPFAATSRGVDDRIRTGDRLDHNQELYQLSYIHRGSFKSSESARTGVYRGFSRTR
jgi:hypothetical protein